MKNFTLTTLLTVLVILNKSFGQQQTCEEFKATYPTNPAFLQSIVCSNDGRYAYNLFISSGFFSIQDTDKSCRNLFYPFGNLLSIRSQEEEDFIRSTMWAGYIIGLTRDDDDKFIWTDGSDIDDHSPNWSTNHPLPDNDCVVLRGDGTGKLDSVLCPFPNQEYTYICKVELVAPIESNRIEFEGSEYVVFNTDDGEMSWMNAQNHCKETGGHLATIDNVRENIFLTQALKDREIPKVWIGLSDLETEGKYRWVDHSRSPYRKWCTGMPNSDGVLEAERCISLMTMEGRKGCFTIGDCNVNMAFICEIDCEEKKTLVKFVEVISNQMGKIKKQCRSCNTLQRH